MKSVTINNSISLVLLLAVVFCYPAGATIINIPDDYVYIQRGITYSSDGDTVLVQPGVYYEHLNLIGRNIVLASLFLITGDRTFISLTVIDGSLAGTVITIINGEDSTAIVTGFTIQNGLAEDGAGIYCLYSDPVIKDNRICDNVVDSDGGGIYCQNCNPKIINNIICNNHGSGIYCFYNSSPHINNNSIIENSDGGIRSAYNSNPIISGNTIADNFTLNSGGGIYIYESSPTISNNMIYNNTCRGRDLYPGGGGICCVSNSFPIISYNSISGNSALESDSFGGGIHMDNSSPIISHNTISRNFADDGGAISCYSNSEPVIVNTICWDDSISDQANELLVHPNCPATITYCNIQGGWNGEGNIDSDPLFVDIESAEFHLLPGSPCIDAGDPDSPYDPDNTIADIGAFYFEQQVGIDDVINLPDKYQLFQNYPNPFNPSTVIYYTLAEQSQVSLEIFNILGQRVASLFEGAQQSGEHRLTWNTAKQPSGIYFARLNSNNKTESIRMLLLK
ncbi:MAG: T9SS type A sorting domain-containing protein [candidate division Zixibacteria bacterium]|nr:T9SS type A sorting domain-containing protein [candidate division Zixibacteria bacterium]